MLTQFIILYGFIGSLLLLGLGVISQVHINED